ncbi:hypothetical protein TUM20985_28190 [Mycobacterium antarcticum]|uniref:hypothetical protein n=1 Tax=unclassified Mycolicibacterium TaxID=2636767 RepID=UPI0023A07379|nr:MULTISPECIES: hypothetical protein [unclassified Mycolicibacterium]BDX32272.1 hypothetical protein TUM20985_28190 [Mycolicibacterium sp. TUM20985]GLP84176.1 hypothetical protein TUM20984_55960 [Mycolicibacterium sp. TUM20984]
MNDQPRKPKVRNNWTSAHDDVLARIATAAERVKRYDNPETRAALFEAVEAARIAGVGWTKIGDTLGIASGNAYQRYRKRQPTGTHHLRTTHEDEPPC